jgi:hypothetical protein
MDSERRLKPKEIAVNPEGVEDLVSSEVLNEVSLNRLKTCGDPEGAAEIFLENPAAFTMNSSAAVASSTKLSDKGIAAYASYLDLLEDETSVYRKEILNIRYKERPSRQGTDQHGKSFVRQERVPAKTMQVAEFLYPEIGFYILKKGIEAKVLALPSCLSLTKIKPVLSILFSRELPEAFDFLVRDFEKLEFLETDIKALRDYLQTLNGNLLRPLITDLVGETDLATNIFISLGAKLDLYQMLKQT